MSKKYIQIVFAIIVVIFLLLLYFFAGPGRPVRLDSSYRPVMGTFARVVVVAKNSDTAKECIKAGFVEIEKVDMLMSDYKDDSDISRINKNAFNEPVKVTQPTFEVLQKSIEFSKLTDGTFDITVGPLVDLWRRATEANSVPSEDVLSVARSKVGYDNLILDSIYKTVKFKIEGMRIDLGGIAKGYAIDKAIEEMQSAGAIAGMVDIGGDIRCFGQPSGGKKFWQIGLQDPNLTSDDSWPVAQDKPLLILQLTDAAVATSGGYRRFTLIEGQRFSHIFNSHTGESAQGLASVTIISQNALDADALATAVSVLGVEKGLSLIESIPHTEAILITPQNEIKKTPNVEKFISGVPD